MIFIPPTPPRRKFRRLACDTPLPCPMPDLSEFMTTKEAAEKLGFTVRAVNRLVASKKLDGLRLGRMYLISKTSVTTYLDKTRGMSKNDPRRKPTEENQ